MIRLSHFFNGGKKARIQSKQDFCPDTIESAIKELSVACPELEGCASVVFPISHDGQNVMIVIQEIQVGHSGELEAEFTISVIRNAVMAVFSTPIFGVILVEKESIPRNATGRVDRDVIARAVMEKRLHQKCKILFMDRRLKQDHFIGDDRRVVTDTPPAINWPIYTETATMELELQDWMISWISGETGVKPYHIDPQKPLWRYGVDSISAVQFVADVEDCYGLDLPESTLWDYRTVADVSVFLCGMMQERMVAQG